ncbi:hypothetical protein EBR66_07545 [bacterium]|nr:hypothetical protein [bacterium]
MPVTPPITARSARLAHRARLARPIRVIPVTVIAKKTLAKIVPAGPSRFVKGWHGSCYSIAQKREHAKSMPTGTKPVRRGWHDPCKGADRDHGHTTPLDKIKPGINPGSFHPMRLTLKRIGGCSLRAAPKPYRISIKPTPCTVAKT